MERRKFGIAHLELADFLGVGGSVQMISDLRLLLTIDANSKDKLQLKPEPTSDKPSSTESSSVE